MTAGRTLVHTYCTCRVRSCIPEVPHGTEHGPHKLHDVTTQSTGRQVGLWVGFVWCLCVWGCECLWGWRVGLGWGCGFGGWWGGLGLGVLCLCTWRDDKRLAAFSSSSYAVNIATMHTSRQQRKKLETPMSVPYHSRGKYEGELGWFQESKKKWTDCASKVTSKSSLWQLCYIGASRAYV